MPQLRNHENQILSHYVQRMLDPLEKQTKKNWRSVGQILNVSEEDLDLIETDYKAGRSPTVSLIDKLSTFPIVPSMRSFVEALVSCKRYDVATNICNWPWELRTIQWGKLFSTLETRNKQLAVTCGCWVYREPPSKKKKFPLTSAQNRAHRTWN